MATGDEVSRNGVSLLDKVEWMTSNQRDLIFYQVIFLLLLINRFLLYSRYIYLLLENCLNNRLTLRSSKENWTEKKKSQKSRADDVQTNQTVLVFEQVFHFCLILHASALLLLLILPLLKILKAMPPTPLWLQKLSSTHSLLQ